MTKRKYPEGYFLQRGIVLGLPIGIALSVAIGNFAFIGVGIAIGVAIGVAMEEEHKKKGEIIPLTKKEKAEKKRLKKILLIALLIGVGILAGLFLYNFLK